MLNGHNEITNELKTVIVAAREEALRNNSSRIGTEHLLIALLEAKNSIPGQALSSMKIELPSLKKELEKLQTNKDFKVRESSENDLPGNSFLSYFCFDREPLSSDKSSQLAFSDQVIKDLTKAEEFSCYFGEDEISPAHLLLGMLETKDSCAGRLFEELSINIAFLRGKIMHLIACSYLRAAETISLSSMLVSGLKRLVEKHMTALHVVQDLIKKSKLSIIEVPKKEDVLHLVCTAYLSECLYNQIALQRYLLEEAICFLSETAGMLDREISSQIISMTAQHLRQQARQGIEYVWTNEYKLIQRMLNDAEHDLIGSVIEDLWWAYSEDIALDQSFSSALEDHRRTQLLDLQKRRVELSQRLRKIKVRLEDTIRQCFTNKISV